MANLTVNDSNCSLIYSTDNSTGEVDVCGSHDEDLDGMPLSEIFTVTITAILGLSGIFMNIGILTIIIQQKLIKKDYRMLYYMFMTIGDLSFSINCTFVGINIAFKSVYVFKLVGVCLTLMIVMGLVAYQWTAMCIILLLIDLVWTIKHPFSDSKDKLQRFCKVGCLLALVIGVILAVGPFLFWDDIPYELSFCSITKVYGSHVEFFLIETVVVLAMLLVVMVAVSGVLLHQIYKSHTVHYEDRDTVNNGDIFIIDTESKSYDDKLSDTGNENAGYVMDVEDVAVNKRNKVKHESHEELNRPSRIDSRREVHRREFLRSCRTVGIFMLAYIGCVTPYLILSGLGISCTDNCDESPESRVIRALVATALYLLPVIDPILYTKRFDVFKKAFLGVLKKCCSGGENSDTVVEAY